MKISRNIYNLLRTLHMLTAAIWLGSSLMMVLILLNLDATNIVGNVLALETVHSVAKPCALVTLITGLLFSIYTNWGFIKHRWIMVKYLINFIPFILGPLVLGSTLDNLVELAKKFGKEAINNHQFIEYKNLFLNLNLLIATLMVLAFALTVYKPKLSSKKKFIKGTAA